MMIPATSSSLAIAAALRRTAVTARLAIVVTALVVGWPGAAAGQQQVLQQQTECRKAKPGQACEVLMDRAVPVSGRSVTVENETSVTLVLQKKSPFESCKNDAKREELPDVSIVPTLLSLFKDLAGSFIVPVRSRVSPSLSATAVDKREAFLRSVETLRTDASKLAADAVLLQHEYEAEARRVDDFYRTDFYKDGSPDTQRFEAERAERHDAVSRLEGREVPVFAGGENIYKRLDSDFAAYAAAAPDAPDRAELEALLANARRSLDLLSRVSAVIQDARGKLRTTLTYLRSLERPAWEARLPIHGDRNARITASVACTSDVTGKPTLEPPVVVTVKFQGTPMMSLTAGILVSRIPRNSIGIESVADPGSNPPSAHKEIREHPSRPQALPFSFLNVRVWKPLHWRAHRVTLNASPGFGLNSNNGDVSAEFFFGGSVGIGSVFLTAGTHFGHEVTPANGFEVGQVPPPSLSTVPLETSWARQFAFAVSYRIPIK